MTSSGQVSIFTKCCGVKKYLVIGEITSFCETAVPYVKIDCISYGKQYAYVLTMFRFGYVIFQKCCRAICSDLQKISCRALIQRSGFVNNSCRITGKAWCHGILVLLLDFGNS